MLYHGSKSGATVLMKVCLGLAVVGSILEKIYLYGSIKVDCIADTCWNIILYCRKTVKITVLLASLSPRGRTVDREVHVQELKLRPTTGFRQDSNHFQTFDKYSFYLFSEFL